MSKLSIFIIVLLFILLALGLLLKNNKISLNKSINETDEHGCFIAANYTFSEEVGACLHVSDIREQSKKEAAKTAVKILKNVPALAITRIDSGNCTECFIVHLQKGEEKISLEIENGTIKNMKNEV